LKLNGRDWGFIGAAVIVVGGLVALSMIGRKPVPMSAGSYHTGLSTASKRAECMVCHDPKNPAASNPLSAAHPLVWRKEEVSCTVCHVPPASGVPQSASAKAPTLSSTVEFGFKAR